MKLHVEAVDYVEDIVIYLLSRYILKLLARSKLSLLSCIIKIFKVITVDQDYHRQNLYLVHLEETERELVDVC